MKLHDLKTQHAALLDKAESFTVGEGGMSTSALENFNNAMKDANAVESQIKAVEQIGTLRAQAKNTGGMIIPGAPTNPEADETAPRVLTAEYRKDFAAWARSRGTKIGASMGLGLDSEGGFAFPAARRANAAAYEGAGGSGSFILPVVVEQQIIELAPPEIGVESIATVYPTTTDIRLPRKTAHGTAAAKAESTTSTPTSFGGTDPTLDQLTLSAFMIGHAEDASWELLQDVNIFQSFMAQDILLSLAILKEANYVAGSGTGQAQGLLGNVGAGVTGISASEEGESTLANAVLDATFDVMGTLNAVYHNNARFFMSRATSIVIRKAQKQANLFEPIFARVNGVDTLHGYPVTYSTSMPAATTGNTPILFGDFKAGYVIGVRGGAGVNVKILDQPKALQGLLTVLGYQRVDGRVRRSEAIQAISLA